MSDEFEDPYRDLAELIEQAVGAQWSDDQYERVTSVLKANDRINGNQAIRAAQSIVRRSDPALAERVGLLVR